MLVAVEAERSDVVKVLHDACGSRDAMPRHPSPRPDDESSS
jgi:hypothetical protein